MTYIFRHLVLCFRFVLSFVSPFRLLSSSFPPHSPDSLLILLPLRDSVLLYSSNYCTREMASDGKHIFDCVAVVDLSAGGDSFRSLFSPFFLIIFSFPQSNSILSTFFLDQRAHQIHYFNKLYLMNNISSFLPPSFSALNTSLPSWILYFSPNHRSVNSAFQMPVNFQNQKWKGFVFIQSQLLFSWLIRFSFPVKRFLLF